MHVPIGLEEAFEGVVDIITQEAVTFAGEKGEIIVRSKDIPKHLIEQVAERRAELIDQLANADEESDLAMCIMEDTEPSIEQIEDAVR